jgi:6,7-dimethyl-8-ribityllumazine synthase
MLKPVQAKKLRAGKAKFAIVASQYNARYVDSMVRAAQTVLQRAGAEDVEVIRVPGAYEIPIVATRLARLSHEKLTSASGRRAKPSTSAPLTIICLGVILRGETVHAEHIGEAVSRALMEIQVQYEVPIIHEVLLLENENQARVRCLGRQHNRGAEAAQTALAMSRIMG